MTETLTEQSISPEQAILYTTPTELPNTKEDHVPLIIMDKPSSVENYKELITQRLYRVYYVKIGFSLSLKIFRENIQ